VCPDTADLLGLSDRVLKGYYLSKLPTSSRYFKGRALEVEAGGGGGGEEIDVMLWVVFYLDPFCYYHAWEPEFEFSHPMTTSLEGLTQWKELVPAGDVASGTALA
jgi:hypothetical protein